MADDFDFTPLTCECETCGGDRQLAASDPQSTDEWLTFHAEHGTKALLLVRRAAERMEIIDSLTGRAALFIDCPTCFAPPGFCCNKRTDRSGPLHSARMRAGARLVGRSS